MLKLKLKFQYFGHLMGKTDLLEKTLMLGKIEGRRRRGQQKMRRLYGITDSMAMSLSRLRELVMNQAAWCPADHAVAKSWTRLSNWTELKCKIEHWNRKKESEMQDEKGGIIRQQRRKSPLSLADLSHCHHKHSVFPQALNSLIFPINFLCFTFNMRTRIYHMHLYNLYMDIMKAFRGHLVSKGTKINFPKFIFLICHIFLLY